MIRKLRRKFVLINMSLVTLLLLVILGLVFYFTSANLEMESLRMMESIAEQPFRLGTPEERVEEVRLPFFVLQIGPYGEVMATGGGYYDLSDQEFLERLIQLTAESPQRTGVIEAYHLRYYRADTPLHQCLVFADTSSEQATLNNLLKTCGGIGLLGFLLFLGVSVLLSKWAVRPVETAWQQQRQFVADASHELKTPLTVIMTNAELAQSPDYDPARRMEFLQGIVTMSRQMKGLIEQMLELARGDQGHHPEELCRVELSEVVSNGVLPFEPVFFEAGLHLVTQVEPQIAVRGSQRDLGQVVEILLDNARKYAAAGGTTWVTLQAHRKGRCLLTVADQGAPISPQDLENLFKRFYRGDPARSRTGSFGLGLAIAQGIVTRHKGRIWAESREGMNIFSVELPRLS